MNNKKVLTSLILNIIIFIFEIIAVLFIFFDTSETEVSNVKAFKTFTVQSNMLLGITSLVFAIFEILYLKKEKQIPQFLFLFKYVITIALFLTFLTVAIFLSPIQQIYGDGYFSLFLKGNLFMHLLCPILAIISFSFFEKFYKISFKQSFLVIIPTLLYGIIYFLNVIVLKNWNDFYAFTFGGYDYLAIVSATAMILITYGLGLIIRLLNNR